MSRKSDQLRRQERIEILLTTLLDYYLTSKKLKGCSPKTLISMQSILNRFVRFLQARGHSLKLMDVTLQDARDFSDARSRPQSIREEQIALLTAAAEV